MHECTTNKARLDLQPSKHHHSCGHWREPANIPTASILLPNRIPATLLQWLCLWNRPSWLHSRLALHSQSQHYVIRDCSSQLYWWTRLHLQWRSWDYLDRNRAQRSAFQAMVHRLAQNWYRGANPVRGSKLKQTVLHRTIRAGASSWVCFRCGHSGKCKCVSL
jgi:hypothetical protein